MREIQVLDQKTIDKIAAGEVVERPASVVKELVENAMDAGASAITVEIRDGGSTLIRITDNGSGIPKDQIRLAFLRHATSKIRRVEDLAAITSLGFRGEALSSIAAVSQVELITKIPESLTGVRYCIEGGTERVFEEIGAPSGTTFLVRHLFYNTPARAKFLKSPAAEGNAVASVVEQLALSHPELSFKFIQNGQNRLYTSGNGNVKEAVYQIYGRDITRELIPLEGENELFRIRGYIGKPALARANRNFENYFVNGRYVKSKLLAKAIEDAYHGFMMQHRYPFTLLYLEVDGSKVDVNVHPSKMELRFSNQEGMYHQLCLAIQNTLLGAERIPEIHLPNTASTITLYSFSGNPVSTSMPEFRTISLCSLHSWLIDSSLPTNSADTSQPFSRRSLAAAKPSPPLFPLPHTMSGLLRSIPAFSIASTTFRAALSIRTMDGIPIVCMVYSSAFFI